MQSVCLLPFSRVRLEDGKKQPHSLIVKLYSKQIHINNTSEEVGVMCFLKVIVQVGC